MTMTAKQQATATAAFNAGVAAYGAGKGLSTRLTVAAGTARDFWEAGWHKASKAELAKLEAERPARLAAAKADRAGFMQRVEQSRANAILAGKRVDKIEAMRIASNAAIGVVTTY